MPKVRSWRTTSFGVTSILCGLAGFYFIIFTGEFNSKLSLAVGIASIASITNGLGNVFAKDAKVTNSSPTGEAMEVK